MEVADAGEHSSVEILCMLASIWVIAQQQITNRCSDSNQRMLLFSRSTEYVLQVGTMALFHVVIQGPCWQSLPSLICSCRGSKKMVKLYMFGATIAKKKRREGRKGRKGRKGKKGKKRNQDEHMGGVFSRQVLMWHNNFNQCWFCFLDVSNMFIITYQEWKEKEGLWKPMVKRWNKERIGTLENLFCLAFTYQCHALSHAPSYINTSLWWSLGLGLGPFHDLQSRLLFWPKILLYYRQSSLPRVLLTDVFCLWQCLFSTPHI